MSKVTYKKFSTLEEANYVIGLLEKNNIEYLFSENKSSLDASFSSPLLNEFEIKINQKDFQAVEELLINDSEEIINQLPNDYYLFSFTDEELREVVSKKDEWSELDYNLSLHLLKKRGVDLTETEISTLEEKRLNELRKPEKSNELWILAGYIFSILGGMLGFIIGYVLYSQKKTLPNGEQVYEYVESDRVHGKRMIKIGIIIFIIYIILKVLLF